MCYTTELAIIILKITQPEIYPDRASPDRLDRNRKPQKSQLENTGEGIK